MTQAPTHQGLPPGRLSDDELSLRTRAVAMLLEAAVRPDAADPASGYRDLLREVLGRVRELYGERAALAMIVDELVLALDDPAQVEALMRQLEARQAGRR